MFSNEEKKCKKEKSQLSNTLCPPLHKRRWQTVTLNDSFVKYRNKKPPFGITNKFFKERRKTKT